MGMQQLWAEMSAHFIIISLLTLRAGVGAWVVELMIMRPFLGGWILGIMLCIISVSVLFAELESFSYFKAERNADCALGSRVTDGGAMEVNFVGNLYKQGPASELTYALQATVSS